MLDLKRRERRFSCIKWQVFLRSIKMQKGISKFSADVESLPGEAASCRLALLSRGGMECRSRRETLPLTARLSDGRETVLPCNARFKAARTPLLLYQMASSSACKPFMKCKKNANFSLVARLTREKRHPAAWHCFPAGEWSV